MVYAKQHADFLTVTCLEWKHVLKEDRYKNSIADSLNFLVNHQRICVYGFVIMSNHMHLIWQMLGDHKRDDVQRDFLKYTGQQLLKILKKEHSPMLGELLVNAKDRKYQVWERNSLSIPLWTPEVFEQKLEYIHNNPVKAGLCRYPDEYKYSSAKFYERNERDWEFLTSYKG